MKQYKRSLSRLFSFIAALMILLVQVRPALASSANAADLPHRRAVEMLARMTPAEKVGQLFVVTFKGINTGIDTEINSLLTEYHVGGVMLLRENDNFTDTDGTLTATTALTANLQQVTWDAAQVTNEAGYKPAYIPLLIGISQEGDGYPYSQIIDGLGTLPDQMAIGATWDPSVAERTGAVLGSGLRQAGFNLLLGPSLDVLESPGRENGDDLSTRVFGGDPFWVGQMGQAFIRGVHQGGDGQVAVMAKHFPGRGGSDRPSEEEVATVRKTLDGLKQIELAPFFSVTSGADPLAIADGLLVSHIRYQGFQGNIRVTTRPVSIDSTALSQILALNEFTNWRQDGGVIISENLGSTAVRKFIDPTLQVFDARTTARNALLAGNDLLFVDDITSAGDPDSYTSTIITLEYFRQKYDEDPTFAQRVDASVLRILTLKYRLYPNFNLTAILPTEEGVDPAARQQVIQDTAQAAASLISPTAADLATVLPDPPAYQERIVFLMDSVKAQQCAACPETTSLAAGSLRDSVLHLYGPDGAGLVSAQRLNGYSFDQLANYLSNPDSERGLEDELKKATWVVVGISRLEAARPASSAFRQLLSQKPELLRNKKVVVFAFSAPYYLDATDIASVTAYYALYARSQPFVDLAARILFQEVTPHGASPVSIPGVGYDLNTMLQPDPAQVIELFPDQPADLSATPTIQMTASASAVQDFSQGDTIPIRTGVILDHNQHPVPDGTLVRFIIRTGTDNTALQQLEAVTSGGVARVSYRITSNGFIEIKAVSEPALTSNLLQLDIPVGGGALITAVAPTPLPSETPIQADTPAAPTDGNAGGLPGGVSLRFWDWFLMVFVSVMTALLVYNLGRRVHSIRWGIRWALCAMLGGMTSYAYMAIGLPGAQAWLALTGTTGMLVIVILCVGLGFAGGVLWHALRGHPGN
jgi:beta-N-acetylhexosaminidase